jgi:hypothetical protein
MNVLRRALVALVAVSITACAAAAPEVKITHPQYRYVPIFPAGPLPAGQPFHVTWTPQLVRMDAAEPYDVRLCIGLYGSFADPGALKEASSRSSATRPDCPPSGAVVSSGVLRTRSDSGAPLATDLVLPTAVGFYDVRQIEISGVDPAYSVTASGSLLEVRAP